jgi:hypothetical protein
MVLRAGGGGLFPQELCTAENEAGILMAESAKRTTQCLLVA